MKQIFMLLIAVLCIISSSHSEKRYVIKKITNEGSNFFDINNLGEIAYVGLDELGRQQVYLYSGEVIHQLTETLSYSYSYYSIDINDLGHIVWCMSSNEEPNKTKYVIMYYGGSLRKLVDNLYFTWNSELNVKINNGDVVVWHGIPYYGAYTQVYKYDDGVKNLIENVNNPNSYPIINNNGLIAWYGDNRYQSDWDNRIRYINPGDTVVNTIPQGQYEGSSFPVADNNNQIIFNRYNQGIYDLYRFNGSESVKLADSIYQYYYHTNNGNVVYTKGTSGNYSVWRLTSEGYSRLSADGTDNYYPNVNKDGITVWRNQIFEIFVSNETGTKKIGEDCHKAPLINDVGTIAFAGFDTDYYGSAIYIAEYKDVWDFNGRVVLNSEGGQGLEDVTVSAENKILATTNASGEFTCASLDPKTYTFSFSKPGYIFNPPNIEVGLNAHYTLIQSVMATPATKNHTITSEKSVTIFPNPTSMELNIRAGGYFEKIDQITISDMQGRTIKNLKGKTFYNTGEVEIDIADLKPGHYFCRFLIDGESIQKHFSVVR